MPMPRHVLELFLFYFLRLSPEVKKAIIQELVKEG